MTENKRQHNKQIQILSTVMQINVTQQSVSVIRYDLYKQQQIYMAG